MSRACACVTLWSRAHEVQVFNLVISRNYFYSHVSFPNNISLDCSDINNIRTSGTVDVGTMMELILLC